MTRTYELVFIVEPRRSEDDVKAITEKYTSMIEASGATIRYIDHWGKRKLAYPIQNFNEGKYVVVYVTADGVRVPWPDVERVLMQDEKVLRHLVVRTDKDLKRAARGKVQPKMPWDKEEKKEETGASHAS